MNSVMKSESATKEAQALRHLLCLSPPLRALGKFVTANNESFAPKKRLYESYFSQLISDLKHQM